MPLPFARPQIDTLDPSTVREGDHLPEMSIPITTTLIVCGAIASRDFYPGHHDRTAAQVAGSPDVFMNIMTTSGLVGRFITDWAGPNAELVELDVRLGTPNYPNDMMTLEGIVTSVDAETATGRLLDIQFEGRNSRGIHVSGTARLDVLYH